MRRTHCHTVVAAAGDDWLPPAANAAQLMLYQDKAKAAMDRHEETVKIKKGKKRPVRVLKDSAAYAHGKRDAEAVVLGSKKLKAAA